MNKKRILSILGIAIIALLFLLTIVFGFLGHMAITVTLFAMNMVVAVIFYFIIRGYQNRAALEVLERQESETPPHDSDLK